MKWIIGVCIVFTFLCGGVIFFMQKNISQAPLSFDTQVNIVDSTPSADIVTTTSVHDSITIPILIYHQIRDYTSSDSQNDRVYITPIQEFLDEMDYIAQSGYTTLSFDDVYDFLLQGKILPEKSVILTFDDGTISQYDHAFPVLKKYNFTATFFVFTNAPDKNSRYMNWAQLQELIDAGMSVQSHSVFHPNLKKMQDISQIQKELVQSKADIENNLHTTVKYFAYPFGEYTPKIMELVAAAGYTGARTILHGSTHTLKSAYAMPGYLVTDLAQVQRILEKK